MRNQLPLAILFLVAVILAAMPWRRPDPRHEFIFEMYSRLAEGAPACVREGDVSVVKAGGQLVAPGEIRESEHRTAAGHTDGAGGPRL